MMQRAFELAQNGCRTVSPNPMVGCVIVKDGNIIAEGWHECPGSHHAEAAALLKAGTAAKGADLYVTLEPCCHYGRTPPCTEKIIAAGIKRVVAAVRDPNPLVAGKGIQMLQAAGIECSYGMLQGNAHRQNEIFFKFIKTGLPFVTLKLACSLDGKNATATGESRWITGEQSRTEVHRLRSQHKALLTGIGTILTDDPLLTVRLADDETAPTPIRIIADPMALTPPEAAILGTLQKAPVIIAVSQAADRARTNRLTALGCRILTCQGADDLLDLDDLLTQLGAMEIDSLFVEAGGTLAGAIIHGRYADRCIIFIAPMFMGSNARSAIAAQQSTILSEVPRYNIRSCNICGEDIMLDITTDHYNTEGTLCSQE